MFIKYPDNPSREEKIAPNSISDLETSSLKKQSRIPNFPPIFYLVTNVQLSHLACENLISIRAIGEKF